MPNETNETPQPIPAGYKLAIIGSRVFNNKALVHQLLDPVKHLITEVVSGGATGADKIGEEWAQENGIPVNIIRPNWRPNGVYDKGAGFKRNIEIVKAADKILALWDGESRGTENSIDHCIRLGKEYFVIISKPLPEPPPPVYGEPTGFRKCDPRG